MPMDLSQIFDQGQFSLIKPGMDAFNLEQEKQKATLAGILGQEQRAKEMQPYEIQSKQAYTRQANAQAGTMEDHLKVLQGIPLPDRIAVGVAENAGKLRGEAIKKADTEMEQLSALAAAAIKNGGSLPLGITVTNPDHAKYFGTPQGAQLAAQIAKAYWLAKPKELVAAENDRRDTERALALGKMMADSRVTAAGIGGGKGKSGGTDDASITRDLLKLKKASEKLAQLKVYWPQMSEEQRATWVPVAEDLLTQANEEARTNLAGKVDPMAATKGRVPVNPNVNLGAPSGAAANRPQRQTDSQRVTIYKDGKAIGTVPLAQKEQAIKEGYTIK